MLAYANIINKLKYLSSSFIIIVMYIFRPMTNTVSLIIIVKNSSATMSIKIRYT